MTQQIDPNQSTADLTDRQLLELLLTRLSQLESRFDGRDTNPLLPANFAERFERSERQLTALISAVRGIREDMAAERQRRFAIEDRLAVLEGELTT
ncbi:MAG: hypothetical protein ACRD82_18705 [Blastocatellia bacterium]